MPDLMGIWVKAPILKNAKLVIISRCLKWVNPEIYEKFSKEGVLLEHCPEQEGQVVYGKIASIIRASEPKKIIIVTVDGSPHCFTLQAAVNEAAFILGKKVEREHYVVVDGTDLVKVSPEAIRVGRYISLVDKLIKENKWVLKDLRKHSKEYAYALETSDAEIK